MALANVLGFKSDSDFDRSLQCTKTDDSIDELCPKLNIENIAQFITLPPYADVRSCTVSHFFTTSGFWFFFLAGQISENGQRQRRSSENSILEGYNNVGVQISQWSDRCR
jgi:hypothetical protein